MAKRWLFVDKEGNVTTLYTDEINKLANQLGEKLIRRASTVEFNNHTQRWEVRFPRFKGDEDWKNWELKASCTTRAEALSIEEGLFKQQCKNDKTSQATHF